VRVKVITVLGGYGVFGGRIAEALVRRPSTQVRIAGRNQHAGLRFAARIGAEFRQCDLAQPATLDQAIEGATVVVHAAGPFQGTDYHVARRCIDLRSHYVDIADGRDYVTGIVSLHAAAQARGVMVVSGASTVPAISHALVNELRPGFQRIDEIDIALAPGNRNPRGTATIAAILSYLGRPIPVWQFGRWQTRTGWAQPTRLVFPDPLGSRSVYTCEAPDLDLFPKIFGAHSVRFRAGLELNVLNWMLAALSRLRRSGRFESLPRYAGLMARLSRLLLPFGSRNGALAVWARGADHSGRLLERSVALVTDWDGPAIPAAPAILLAGQWLDSGAQEGGAFPCVGFVTLPELLSGLGPAHFWLVDGAEGRWQPRQPPFGPDR
jgi:hypothetical protein